jgi:two-component system response regulator AtoC
MQALLFREGRVQIWFLVCNEERREVPTRACERIRMAVSEHTNGGPGPRTVGLPAEEIIFGRSGAMISIRQKVQKLLRTDVPILIQGENGTGKGLLAQYIHSRSAFCSGAFVKVNCAAIPGALLESELFGYEKGSFTDAHASKPGYVEMAHRGTLFLDEIADLDLSLQAKVLQLLQDGHFSRIGDKQERRAETRVICATNRDLQAEIEAGRFRHDLFYRINVISINLPSLRERREDVGLLAEYFLEQLNARFERDTPPFSEDNIESLSRREWRGNIRELENVVARYAILGSLDNVEPERPARRSSMSPYQVGLDGTIPLKRIAKQAVREMEGNLILNALRENKWNRRKAALALNISYRALIYKIREAGLSPKGSRKRPQAELPHDHSTGLDSKL